MSLHGVNRATLPLIVYGIAEDLTAWTDVGTPVTTGSQADPFGGTDAVQIQDDNAAATEYKKKTVVFTEDGFHTFMVLWKEITTSADKSTIRLWDSTQSKTRAVATITWSTGALSDVTGNVIGNFALGGGWYLTLLEAEDVIAVNANEIRLQPTTGIDSETGTVVFYMRPILILGELLDHAVSFSEPRASSRFEQSGAGVEDAWISGRNQVLEGAVRWIPQTPQATPRATSGWNGAGELPGVNSGWDHFLASAQDKRIFLWVPDRAVSTVNVSSYLVAPLRGRAGMEIDFTRRLSLKIRSSDGSRYLEY